MSPDIVGANPVTTESTDEPAEPWPDETAHFVVVGKSFSTNVTNLTDALVDEYGVDRERDRHVTFAPGEELPAALVTASTWRSLGGWRIIALDSAGQRLSPVSVAETTGDVDYTGDLKAWRASADLEYQRVEVFECEECGKTFDSRDALNGHSGVHADTPDDESPDGLEAVSDE